METTTIEKKTWKNAEAFIEVNPETLEVKVYGKFHDGGGFPGPSTGVLGTIPANLFEQASYLMKSGQRLFWMPIPKTEEYAELRAFCDNIYAKAKAENPWFSY